MTLPNTNAVGNENAHRFDGLTVHGGLLMTGANGVSAAVKVATDNALTVANNLIVAGTSGSVTLGADSNNQPTINGAAVQALSYDPIPSDYSLIAWTGCPLSMSNQAVLTTGGTLYVAKIRVPIPISVTNITVVMSVVGNTLTAGQCFAGLWKASDLTQIGITADQSAAWVGALGAKVAALVGGPFTVTADCYAGFYFNGTTGPTFRTHGTATSTMNISLTGNSSRFGTSSTGLTTTPPPTAGAITAAGNPFFVGLS